MLDEGYKFDKALCELNQEIINLKNSKEYLLGLKMSKLIYAIKHLKIKNIFIGIHHMRIDKKLSLQHKRNENFITYDNDIKTNSRIAVYTCITGNYDKPLEPVFVPSNIDYYIITDMEISSNSNWKKIDINSIKSLENIDNTRKARYIKTHPHELFKNYEYSIWIDSNFRVISDLSRYIKYTSSTIPFASNWHPVRNSIFTEVNACISRKKDDPQLLKRQVEYYKSEGMPNEFGLIETNMIVRRHNNKNCIELMEAWWKEILLWSKRDQLSLPYVAWKQGYSMRDFGFIGTEVRKNPSVQVVLHDSQYKSPIK